MKQHSLEAVVGVFVLICLICVAYLTIQLGRMELFGGDYYQIDAAFTSVSGLKEGATVDMAGVPIGHVEKITLDKETGGAVVLLNIENGIPIDAFAIASVRTMGLIGDKYIRISPAFSEEILENGGSLTETESSVDIEDIIGKYAFGDVEGASN